MTGEHLEAILKTAQAKADKEGYATVPDGGNLTLYVAHDGVPLTVSRVEGIKMDGEIVYARTARGERYALGRSDLFAIAIEGAVGAPARRAGFG